MNKFSILIVDDNYDKVNQISQVATQREDCNLETVNNVRDGLQRVRDNFYEVIIVDMILPNSLGDFPSNTGGVDFINAITRSDNYHKPLCIIAVTSHQDAFAQNESTLKRFGIPFVLLDNSSCALESLISNKIDYYLSVKSRLDSGPRAEDISSEKITLKWLYQHVEWKHWMAFVGIVGASFIFGAKAGGTEFVKELLGKPKISCAAQVQKSK